MAKIDMGFDISGGGDTPTDSRYAFVEKSGVIAVTNIIDEYTFSRDGNLTVFISGCCDQGYSYIGRTRIYLNGAEISKTTLYQYGQFAYIQSTATVHKGDTLKVTIDSNGYSITNYKNGVAVMIID